MNIVQSETERLGKRDTTVNLYLNVAKGDT